jgi:hypothetical protein
MRLRTVILGLASLSTFCVDSAPAWAQSAPVGATQDALSRSRALTQRREFDSGNATRRSGLGTYQVQRYQGYKTRSENWRTARWYASMMKEARSPLSTVSPIEQILQQRNLLSARSPLSRVLLQSSNPSLFLSPNAPPPAGVGLSAAPASNSNTNTQQSLNSAASPVSPSTGGFLPNSSATSPQVDQQFQLEPGMTPIESLQLRIKNRSQEYYAKGLEHFRKQDFLKSKNSFELARELQSDSPKVIIACLLASHFRADFSQSQLYMGRLLKAAKSIDDMKADLISFEIDSQRLQRLIDQANLSSQQNPNVASPKAMLAYFSFLRGDYGAAIQAAEAARDIAAPLSSAAAEDLERFSQYLRAAQAQPSTPKL